MMVTDQMVEAAFKAFHYGMRPVMASKLNPIDREYLHRAIEAAIAAMVQPIASAPRDGTDILAYFSERNRWDVVHCVAENYWSSSDYHYCETPTHWMPLPPPPVEAGK